MYFRSVLFWLHLAAGVFAGVVIGIMCVTGVALTYEKQIVAFAERDLTRVVPPAPDAPRLSLDDLAAKVRAKFPAAPAQLGVTVASDPTQAVVFSAGRTGAYYVDPYTGEVRPQGAKGTRDFLHLMEDWHRWLALTNDQRGFGKGVTGACNAAFLFLAVSGLYLWWPRRWTRSMLRPSLWFVGRFRGKARNWNWHNVIGFWSAPVLVVLTASGMVISYRWASDLVYSVTGTTPPAGPPPMAEVSKPESGAQPLGLDALFAAARTQVRDFESISLRFGGNAPRGLGGGAPVAVGKPEGDRRPAPVTAAIKMPGNWPLFYVPTWQLDPFTGATLKRESFSDLNAGRQARTWLRFLHTGEALGWMGQTIAGLATLGGAFLVWTGFALAIHRFRNRKAPVEVDPTSAA